MHDRAFYLLKIDGQKKSNADFFIRFVIINQLI